MKICLINSLYRPYIRGGAETVTENIIRGLKNEGHEVFLITLGHKQELEDLDGLKIYRIKTSNIFSFININKYPVWFRLIWHPVDVFNISGYLKVKKILVKESPTVVMTHNLKGIGYLIPKLISRLNIKHIHTVHDVQLSRPSGLVVYGQEKPFLIIDKIYEKICRWLFGSPDVLVSPSKWLLDYYNIRGFFCLSKKEVIKNPVVKFGSPTESKSIQNRDIVFTYVGQLEHSKGILFLIRVLKKLPYKHWQLKIIGSGSLEKEVKDLIKDDRRFNFYGYVKHSSLANIFYQTDITIAPSFCYENSPTVIYESFSFGVPVIASDIGGIPELVKDDYNGFTFSPNDEKNLISVLEHYLKHQGKIIDLKKNAAKSVQGLDLKEYVRKLMAVAQ